MVGNKAQKAVAAALTGMLALGSVAPALAASKVGDGNMIRLDGSYDTEWSISGTSVSGSKGVDGVDRYDTALDAFAFSVRDWENDDFLVDDDYNWAVKNNWADADKLVLASGTSYADALSANGLAGSLRAPVMITPGDKLGEQAKKAIEYLVEKRDVTVYIVGGEAAISADVEKAVADIDSDNYEVDVERVAGEDRMATSLAAVDYYNSVYDLGLNPTKKTIFIANGWAWADALSVSAIAYRLGAPILLTNTEGTLSDEQVEYIKDEIDEGVSVYAIGGPAEAAYDQIKDVKLGSVKWVYGDNRYDTNAKVIDNIYSLIDDDSGLWSTMTVATGKNFPDALVGGAFAGNHYSTLVLVGKPGEKDWSAGVKAAYDQLDWDDDGKGETFLGYIMGGEDAISKATAKAIANRVDVATSGL